jgi:phosphoribosylaminoimidazole (AIR) synthetase
MGAGFAIFVPKEDAAKAIEISEQLGIKAYQAGTVEKGIKQVVIEPLGITFEGESLDLRA